MQQCFSSPHRRATTCALPFIVLMIMFITPSVHAQSCCDGGTGNVDCDNTTQPDVSDLVTLIDHLFLTYTPLCCPAEGNVDGDPEGVVDIADVTAFIDFLYLRFTETAPCDAERVISDSMRLAIIRTIAPVIDSLVLHSDHFLDDAYSFLTANPKFEATGIDTVTRSVWARFLDGTIYLAVDNLAPATDSGTARLVAQANTPARTTTLSTSSTLSGTRSLPSGLPWSTNVRSLVTVDSHYNPANSLIEQMLTDHGYTVISRDADVDALRHVGGDGVLYMMVHGGHAHMRYNRDIFLLETATTVDSLTLLSYREDILINRLAIMQVVDRAENSSILRFALTPDFIIGNWNNFAPNAMVFINTAGSLGPEGITLRDLLIEKKASTCFGWSGPVDADAANFLAGFLFDRLLGANRVEPVEEPSQRAFDYQSVLEDVGSRNVAVAFGNAVLGAEFTYVTGSGDFGLLSPSIRQLSVDSNGVMTISGLFGDDPGDAGRVLIGGNVLPVSTWEPTQIRVQLPDSGEGSMGRVAIEIGERIDSPSAATRRSNEVNLTDWRGRMVFTHRDLSTLTTSINADIHLRADLHSYRDEPHTVPIQPVVSGVGMPDAAAQILGAGTHNMLDPQNPDVLFSYSWSGSCTLPLLPTSPAFLLNATFDTQNYELTLNLSAVGDSCVIATRITGLGDSTGAFLPVSIDTALYDDKSQLRIVHPLEPNWDIRPGLRQATTTSTVDPSKPAAIKLEWNTISAAYPPDPSAPR